MTPLGHLNLGAEDADDPSYRVEAGGRLVSLQGSLETFALPDVMALLATNAKSGELRVTGRRSPADEGPPFDARLSFSVGRICGHDPARTEVIADTVFECLRLRNGTFAFTPGDVSIDGEAVDVAFVLDQAEARLAEWRENEAVVLSRSALLRLVDPAPGSDLTLTSPEWSAIVSVGSGRSVSGTLAVLGWAERDGCRVLSGLIERGLLRVDRAASSGPDGIGERTDPLDWPTPPSSWSTTLSELTGPSGAADRRAGSTRSAKGRTRRTTLRAVPAASGPGERAQSGSRVCGAGGPGTAGASTEGDELVDRGLLLKFLSSVRN